MATILIVDTNAADRNAYIALLGNLGYRILEAANGIEALDLAQAELPDLIITDIIMPLMEGEELIRNLREIKPDIKIIVVSGYGNEAVQREKIADAFIKKPFESIELLSAVRQLLDTGIRRSPLY